VQSPDVIDIFASLDENIIEFPEDCAATPAKARLAKMLLRRSYTGPQVQTFL
jgi:hypothetical protein